MRKFLFLAFLSFFTISEPVISQDISTTEVFEKMMTSINNLKTLKYRLYKSERINGKMEDGDQDVKLQVSPYMVYLKIYKPDEGAEVLYVEGERDGDALVNANKFLVPSLNLDPNGFILRKNQHHSVKELGFAYTGDIINHVYQLYKDKINEYSTLEGSVTFDGRDCYKVTLENREYTHEYYTVQQGEDIITIARKLRANEYMILEDNDIDDFDDVKPGQKIKYASTYSKSVIIYVDKRNFLPIYQEMYDGQGLLAIYKITKLQVNPTILREEFTKKYEEYDF